MNSSTPQKVIASDSGQGSHIHTENWNTLHVIDKSFLGLKLKFSPLHFNGHLSLLALIAIPAFEQRARMIKIFFELKTIKMWLWKSHRSYYWVVWSTFGRPFVALSTVCLIFFSMKVCDWTHKKIERSIVGKYPKKMKSILDKKSSHWTHSWHSFVQL